MIVLVAQPPLPGRNELASGVPFTVKVEKINGSSEKALGLNIVGVVTLEKGDTLEILEAVKRRIQSRLGL